MLRDILKFLWRRDSESAILLGIALGEYLSEKDLKELWQYYRDLQQNREAGIR